MAIKKTKKKPKLSAEEKKTRAIQRKHKADIRRIFRQTGFSRINSLSDYEFEYDGQKTDFDDVYVYENIVACIEYTTSKSANVGSHLKGKKVIYDKIDSDHAKFIEFYCGISSDLSECIVGNYSHKEIIVKIIYCSSNNIEPSHKSNIPNPIYFEDAKVRYFKNLTDCVHKSAFYEFASFLDIEIEIIGESGKINTGESLNKYSGLLLPEENSNFDKDYKVVSFYIDPEALLRCSYVLRKDGWRDSQNVYQRMISKKKIDSIRRHLRVNKRVFVNNIIATLPIETKVVDGKGNTVDPNKISSTKPVTIQVPDKVNSIGLIDGQHRTFSYFESIEDDAEIAKLRRRQNLLVTGIVYPADLHPKDREKFEARLFLEINSTQTNAKSNLKQAIGLILEPFSSESIATRVMMSLDESTGPLGGMVERYWFDSKKLKTTSVISYGLKALVKTSGTDSLYSIWNHPNKSDLIKNEDQQILDDYVKFCVTEIDKLLSATKIALAKERWTADSSVAGRFITTTNINSLLICLRIIIENKNTMSFETYKAKLSNISRFKFSDYHSSQYARMAEAIYAKYFS